MRERIGMNELTEKFKEEGCKNCGSYEERKELSQEGDNKILSGTPYCKRFKQKLKNTNACEEFQLHPDMIRQKISEQYDQVRQNIPAP